LEGLWEIAPGRGRKATYSPERIKAVIDATLQSKPAGSTHWSCRSMAAAQGISKSTVSNVWRSHNLKPHLTKTFKLSGDPKFLEKLTDVVGLYLYKRHRHQEFLKFLRRIDREFPGKTPLHLVMDNYGTHGTPEVKTWLTKHPRFVVHYVPTSCSWLNLIERWFAELTNKRIRRGSFLSVDDLIEDAR
jgi:transposase